MIQDKAQVLGDTHPSQGHIVHNKCHMDWRGNELVPPPQEATESPPEP